MISAETRLNAGPIWAMVDYWLNGVLFLLLGLQIKRVVETVPPGSMGSYLMVSAAVAATAIALRFLWVYVTAYTPGLWKTATGSSGAPRGNRLFFISWTGMRGAISLAAALALPLVLPNGEAFPARGLIIFVTFAVIVFTLIVQGGSLPLLIRLLGLEREGEKERDKATRAEYAARIRTLEAGVAHMDSLVAAGEIPRDVGERYKREREHRMGTFERHRKAHADEDRRELARTELDALKEATQAERVELLRLRSAGEIDDDILHRIERDLDEQELRLQARQDTLR
jgi:NhaP-type Na+/H+ or K+/H+ antiporter